MKLDTLKTDKTLERGAWVSIDPTAKIKVVYTNSPEYRFKLRQKMKPFAGILQRTGDFDDAMNADSQEQLAIDMIVEHTLLDWDGIEYEGQVLPYSKDNARRLLTELPAFREIVEQKASQLSNFRKDVQESEAKNSVASSVGS